jgi:hypothetical protein
MKKIIEQTRITKENAKCIQNDDISFFKHQEQEVLLSIHTLFRVVEIQPSEDDNQFWEVELKLTSETNYKLRYTYQQNTIKNLRIDWIESISSIAVSTRPL